VDEVGIAVVTGVVAAGVWAALALALRWWLRKRHFGPLAGTYTVTRKLGQTPEPDVVVIRVSGNVLEVEALCVPNAESVTGQIVMNEQLWRSGRGHYDHLKTNGDQLFGFWDVQVKDADTLLIHTTFVDQANHRAVVTGYVWRRR
jgi:hypothetical protein